MAIACVAAAAVILVLVNRGAIDRSQSGPGFTTGGDSAGLAPASGATRPVYRFSVVPGGVFSASEVRTAMGLDAVVAAHYAGLNPARLRTEQVQQPRLAYMSYRVGDRIYWTKRKLPLQVGETVLTDGTNTIRARCGNAISDVAQAPVLEAEPAAHEFDALGEPTLQAALPGDPDVDGVTEPGSEGIAGPGPIGTVANNTGSISTGGGRWPVPLSDGPTGTPDGGGDPGPNPNPTPNPGSTTDPCGGVAQASSSSAAAAGCDPTEPGPDPGPNPPGPNPPGPNPPGPNPPGPNPPGPNPPGPNPPGPNPPGPNPPGPNPPGPNPPGPNPPGPNPPGPNPPGPNPPGPNPDPPGPNPPSGPDPGAPLPVPEPGTLTLIGIGAASGIARYMRNRKRSEPK